MMTRGSALRDMPNGTLVGRKISRCEPAAVDGKIATNGASRKRAWLIANNKEKRKMSKMSPLSAVRRVRREIGVAQHEVVAVAH